MNKKMRITERLVSLKRHTIGYVIDGHELTRREAAQLVRSGNLSSARVAVGRSGPYLVGTNTPIYSLPARFPASRRFASKKRA